MTIVFWRSEKASGHQPSVQYAYGEIGVSGAQVNHSRMVSMTYPNNRIVNDNYAAGIDDRISRVTSLSDSTATLEQYSYLGLGTVVKRAHPEPAVDLTYIKQPAELVGDAGDQYNGLDCFGRVVDQRWIPTASPSQPTDRFQYGYDRDSNRQFRDNLVNAVFGELYHPRGVVDTYDGSGNLLTTGYDLLNRLPYFGRGQLNAARTDFQTAPGHTQQWGLDAVGNWKMLTTDGGAPQNRMHNVQNQITSIDSGLVTPTYDYNGNTTKDETGRVVTYDAWNRPVQDGGGGASAYAYDALGRRITTAFGDQPVRDLFYSSAWQVVEERNVGSSTAQAQYVWSPVYVDALVERDRGAERIYTQQDANWNVTAAVSTAGVVQERFVYDPYGKPSFHDINWNPVSDSLNWVYLHQGGRYDLNSGLYNFRNRDYSPTLGRWFQQDPLDFGGGSSNFYLAYTNNPTSLVDPTGNVAIIIHGVLSDGTPWSFQMFKGLHSYWKSNDLVESNDDTRMRVYRFVWTKDGQKPPAKDAVGKVADMKPYQHQAADSLKGAINDFRKLLDDYKCDEPIDIIAHSMGTLIALDALQKGAAVDNVIFLGSPLNAKTAKSDIDLALKNKRFRGSLTNYWSGTDLVVPAFRGLQETKWLGDLPGGRIKQVDFTQQAKDHTDFQTMALTSQYYATQIGATKGFGKIIKNSEFKDKWDAIVSMYQLKGPG
jgi:RHS repeat-associated protein